MIVHAYPENVKYGVLDDVYWHVEHWYYHRLSVCEPYKYRNIGKQLNIYIGTSLKTMVLTIFGSISGFFKITTSYSYLNNYSPFHHFYADLKILRNCRLLINKYCLGKVSQL